MRSRSSDASLSSSRCRVSICEPLSVADGGRIAADRRCSLAHLLIGDACVGNEVHRAHEQPRQRARSTRAWRAHAASSSATRRSKSLPNLLGGLPRFGERSPHAEHDRPTQQRETREQAEHDLRHGARVERRARSGSSGTEPRDDLKSMRRQSRRREITSRVGFRFARRGDGGLFARAANHAKVSRKSFASETRGDQPSIACALCRRRRTSPAARRPASAQTRSALDCPPP